MAGFAPWAAELPFDKVAERARVSERTVYRHFPTQRHLVQAVTAHVVKSSGWQQDELHAESLAAVTARAFTYFGTLIESRGHEPEAQSPEMKALRAKRLDTIERIVALPPSLRARFDTILELAQLYARVREEQASQLTLGWPVARRALRRLGESCVRRGVIHHPDDIYFLERDEIAGTESRNSSVAERRELWARNRRLTPPLVLGTMPKFVTKMHEDAIAKMTAPAEAGEGMLRGMPASSGRVTGVARVLFDLADADRLAPGEILVTTATTPAWTPLFSRAAGIVTDGGSLVAHASLVAREYGIPAVVALGDATRRVRDGQRITIDGSTGLLELLE